MLAARWLASPNYFNNNNANGRNVNTNGNMNNNTVNNANGVRASVSLTSGVEFVDGGDGSMANPYVVKME